MGSYVETLLVKNTIAGAHFNKVNRHCDWKHLRHTENMGRSALLLALVLAITPGLAFGQAAAQKSTSNEARHGAGLGFGEVVMLGDFNTNFSNGIGFNLNYAYESGTRFGLLVNIHWNNHSSPTNINDSLSIKGVTPNLKFNVVSIDRLTMAVFGGLGALKVDETLGDRTGSFMLFALDAGIAANVDVDPHFRFGPSFTVIQAASGTDATGADEGLTPLTMGGMLFELFFNVMYLF